MAPLITTYVVLVVLGLGCLRLYRLRTSVGYVGSWRWRHGGAARYRDAWEIREAEREVLRALTAGDRQWLTDMGWKPGPHQRVNVALMAGGSAFR